MECKRLHQERVAFPSKATYLAVAGYIIGDIRLREDAMAVSAGRNAEGAILQAAVAGLASEDKLSPKSE
jgi:hypothetical protein